MSKNYRFLGLFGFISACGVSHAAPYPSWKELWEHLHPKTKIGMSAMFRKTFKEVYRQADESGFKHLKCTGEAGGKLTLPMHFDPKFYDPKKYRNWDALMYGFGGGYGFFSCTIQNISVFGDRAIATAVEEAVNGHSCEHLNPLVAVMYDPMEVAEITRVCQTLFSEAFVKNLLTDAFVNALYDNRDVSYSHFDILISPYQKHEQDELHFGKYTHKVRFDILYSQHVRESHRKKNEASAFSAQFRFVYDLEKRDFLQEWDEGKGRYVPYRVQLECLWIDGKRFFSYPFMVQLSQALCDASEEKEPDISETNGKFFSKAGQWKFSKSGVPETFEENRRKSLGLKEDEDDFETRIEEMVVKHGIPKRFSSKKRSGTSHSLFETKDDLKKKK